MRAGELAEIFALRGYDAVVVTTGHDLASAAASPGIDAVVPAV